MSFSKNDEPSYRNGNVPKYLDNGNSAYHCPMNIGIGPPCTMMLAEDSGRVSPTTSSSFSPTSSCSAPRSSPTLRSSPYPPPRSSFTTTASTRNAQNAHGAFEPPRETGPYGSPGATGAMMMEHQSGRAAAAAAVQGRRNDDCAHPRVQCNECRRMIGDGVRFKCLDCIDYDLCATCEEHSAVKHASNQHLFCKIRDSRIVDVDSYRRTK